MPTTERSAHWVTLGEAKLQVLREQQSGGKARYGGEWSAAYEGEQVRMADVPVVYSAQSLVAGLGYSRVMRDGQGAPIPGYSRCRNACTRWPGWVMPAGYVSPAAYPPLSLADGHPIVASIEYADMLWFLTSGSYIIGYPFGTGAPVEVTLGTTWRGASLTLFDGSMYVGGFSSVTGQPASLYRFDGRVWTQSSNAGRAYLATVFWVVEVNGALQGHVTLVGTDTPSSYRYCVSGSNPLEDADWGAAYQVGDPSNPIVGLVAAPQHVYFAKTSGIFDTDELGRSPNLTRRLDLARDATYNATATLLDGSYLYYSTGMGLARLDLTNQQRQDEIASCQPAAGLPNETEIVGPTTALLPSGDGWTGAFIYNTLLDRSYLCYGRDRGNVPGFGPMLWHGSEADIEGKVTHAHIAVPDGGPRLWIAGTNDGVPFLSWQSLPRASSPLADFLAGGTMRYAQDWDITFPTEDWGSPTLDKAPTILDSQQEGLGPDATLEILTATDGGAFTSQGVIDTSPRQVVLPTGTAASLLSVCQFRVKGANPTAGPPRWRELRVPAQVNAHQFESRNYVALFGKKLGLKNGGVDRTDQLGLLEYVQSLQSAGPTDFIDELGRGYTVTVRSGQAYDASEDDALADWTWALKVRLTIRTRPAFEGSALSDDIYVSAD